MEPLVTPRLLSRGGLDGSRETPSPSRGPGECGGGEGFQSMWSWYYGSRDQSGAGQERVKQRSDSTSFDLTEALDPEWYFR